MKRILKVTVGLLLTFSLLFVGNGINFLHCSHSDTVRIMLTIDDQKADDDGCCSMKSNCMTVEHYSISNTDRTPQFSFDSNVMLESLSEFIYGISFFKRSDKNFFITHLENKGAPPRALLSKINVLII